MLGRGKAGVLEGEAGPGSLRALSLTWVVGEETLKPHCDQIREPPCSDITVPDGPDEVLLAARRTS